MTYREYPYRNYGGHSRSMPTAQIEHMFGVTPDECPFCHNPYCVLTMLGKDRAYRVDCQRCGCEGPEGRGPEEALRLWHLRDMPTYPTMTPMPKR